MRDAHYDALEERDVMREMERLEDERRAEEIAAMSDEEREYYMHSLTHRRTSWAGRIAIGLFLAFIGTYIVLFVIGYVSN
jgi:hypothetical protein